MIFISNEFNHHSTKPDTLRLGLEIRLLINDNSFDQTGFLAVLNAQSAETRNDFYENYLLGQNHYLIDHAVLDAATDGEIAIIAKNAASNPRERNKFQHDSQNPGTIRLTLKIQSMVSNYHCPEKELADLIKSQPGDTRMDFFTNYKFGQNHFNGERVFLHTGTEDEIIAFVKNQPAEYLIDAQHSDLISIPLNRGLTKVLDTMYNIVPLEEHDWLLTTFGIFLHPAHKGNPRPENEAGQNYLRALDYLLAKGLKINASHQDDHYGPQIEACALEAGLLPELEARGADFQAYLGHNKSDATSHSGAGQHYHSIEGYVFAKSIGQLSNTGNNWQDWQANSSLASGTLWKEIHPLLTTNADEAIIIGTIKKAKFNRAGFAAVESLIINKGYSHALHTLIESCEEKDKAVLAQLCLEPVSRCVSPKDKIDPAHDQRVLACLDVAISYGARINDGYLGHASTGANMIVTLAELKRLDLIPAVVKHGGNLKEAKQLARNSVYCDNEQGVGPWHTSYPTAKNLLQFYKLPGSQPAQPAP